MKFYLAGKMAGATWRPTATINTSYRQDEVPDGFPVVPLGIRDHEMVGPFCLWDVDDNDHGLNIDSGAYAQWITRWQAVYFCCDAIEQCDVFFAWIDDLTCYGTLAEIGYARALKKPIWIAGPHKIIHVGDYWNDGQIHGNPYSSDLWFACAMADRILEVDDDTHPLAALQEMIGPETREERVARLASELLTVSR